MQLSKHNIISKISESDKFILLNILIGSADIITAEDVAGLSNGKFKDPGEYITKGYLVDPDEEEKLYRQKYIEFIENRETDEIQLFFVTNYTCNFSCSYCYQDAYTVSHTVLSTEIIDSFYSYIHKNFGSRKKYVTLFGGEPLLPGANHKKLIEYFLQKGLETGIDIAIVTNGFHLAEYLDTFKHAFIREIQVTLDGTEQVHNLRRPLKNGNGTFQKIAEGIDKALETGLPVNLRMVIDKQNIESLPGLATYAIKRGWTSNPLFKTQFGRNYELHHCQAENHKLYSRVSMYEDIYKLIKQYPQILEFHRPAFSVSKYLFEEGKLPSPLFDSCPGTKTEWAFDYTGKIYACTATVGKKGEELGQFYPKEELESEKIADWEDRDVLSVKECQNCNLQLACGGGCAAVAKNRTGTLKAPDCRPVKELIGLGIGIYFKELVE